MKNITYSVGGIVILDMVKKEFDLFSKIFDGIEGNMKNFIPLIKVYVNNKLIHSVSIHQILEIYPRELMNKLELKNMFQKEHCIEFWKE